MIRQRYTFCIEMKNKFEIKKKQYFYSRYEYSDKNL